MASNTVNADDSVSNLSDIPSSSRSENKIKKSVRFRDPSDQNSGAHTPSDLSGDVGDKSAQMERAAKEAAYKDSKTKFPQKGSAISVRMEDLELDNETEDDLSDTQEKTGKEFERDLLGEQPKSDSAEHSLTKRSESQFARPVQPLQHASKLVEKPSTNDSKKQLSDAKPSSPLNFRDGSKTKDSERQKPKADNTEKTCYIDKRRLSEVRPADEIRCTCEDFEKYPEHIRSESREKKERPTENGTKPSEAKPQVSDKQDIQESKPPAREKPQSLQPKPEQTEKPETPVSKPETSKSSQQKTEKDEYDRLNVTKKDSSTLGKLWDNLKSATNNLAKKPSTDIQQLPQQKPTAFRDTQSLSSVPASGLPDFIQRFSSASKLADLVKPESVQKAAPISTAYQTNPHIKIHAKIDVGTGKIEKIVLENTESDNVTGTKEPKFEFLPVEQAAATNAGTPNEGAPSSSQNKQQEQQKLADEPVEDTQMPTSNSQASASHDANDVPEALNSPPAPYNANTVSEFLMERPITDALFSRPAVGRKKSQGRASEKRLHMKSNPVPFNKSHESLSDNESKRKRKRVRFADSDELIDVKVSELSDSASENEDTGTGETSSGIKDKIMDQAKQLCDSAKDTIVSFVHPTANSNKQNQQQEINPQNDVASENSSDMKSQKTSDKESESSDHENASGFQIISKLEATKNVLEEKAKSVTGTVIEKVNDLVPSLRTANAEAEAGNTETEKTQDNAVNKAKLIYDKVKTGLLNQSNNLVGAAKDTASSFFEDSQKHNDATNAGSTHSLEKPNDSGQNDSASLIDNIRTDGFGKAVKDAVANVFSSGENVSKEETREDIPSQDIKSEARVGKASESTKQASNPQESQISDTENVLDKPDENLSFLGKVKDQILDQAGHAYDSAKEVAGKTVGTASDPAADTRSLVEPSENSGSQQKGASQTGKTIGSIVEKVKDQLLNQAEHTYDSVKNVAGKIVGTTTEEASASSPPDISDKKEDLSEDEKKSAETTDKATANVLVKAKDQLVHQAEQVYDSAKETAGKIVGAATEKLSLISHQSPEPQKAKAPDTSSAHENARDTVESSNKSGYKESEKAQARGKGSFIDLLKSEGLGPALRSIVSNTFVGSSDSEKKNEATEKGDDLPTHALNVKSKKADADKENDTEILQNSDILTEESEDELSSKDLKNRRLSPTDSDEMDAQPNPIHATRSLTDLKDDHSSRTLEQQQQKADEDDSSTKLADESPAQHQDHPQEHEGLFDRFKHMILHALEHHPEQQTPNPAVPQTKASLPSSCNENCVDYCVKHSGEFLIADPDRHMTRSRTNLTSQHDLSEPVRETENNTKEINQSREASSAEHGMLNNVYGTVKEMLSFIFVAEHGESPNEGTTKDVQNSEESNGENKNSKTFHNTDQNTSESEDAEDEVQQRQANNEQARNEATLDESILRTRRARRKKPPSGIETGTFSMPYSFNQQGPPISVDLNDDSESDAHTLPDHMFRPPGAVRYAAYIIGGCMVSMVLLALQERVTESVWIRPEVWIPRLAVTVLVTLMIGLVYGFVTKTDFVRKPNSNSRLNSDSDRVKNKT
ncbi:uncharacterized protein LOC129590282 [Paramacrobiotus metropolitanus]|uniref:uncharacterized protein LOC129590282 n=1 Tax=Paramacrobiotus metropolitanus TaxID=2943436 RepID=UPI002445A676|nr:uncharacterized protein LOC129590282 [Paramacrobiotus metropolitanus]